MEGLPVEIVRTIFLELCSRPAIFPLQEDEPRLLVTRVSSQWRAIALSTPALWANYFIGFTAFWPGPQPGPIRAWISRAAKSPLSFAFRGLARYFDTSPMIVDIMFPVIHRCSFLSLETDTAVLNRLLALPPSSFHTLQSIAFLIEDNARAATTPFSTAFESCPQLHTFALVTIGHYHPENLRIVNLNVPWHQSTTLHLCSPLILAHECFDILRRCTSLQECGIHISPVDHLALQRIIECPHRPTILPFLHTLHVKFLNLGDNNHRFLHAFYLPQLRRLQPRGSESTAPWSLSMFQSVLSNMIQELDLSVFKFPENLPETLALVPNLEILWLGDASHEYSGVMRALGRGALSPRLTALHLGSVESFDILFDIIEARIAAAYVDRGISAFVKVTVSDRGTDPLDEARLIGLTEAGVQIQFGHPRW